MSLSTYTADHFDDARKELKVARGLESIGETRFGTIYWSLNSLLRGMDALEKVVKNPDLCIESEVLHRIFDDEDSQHDFTQGLKRLGAVLMPFARAIQCLESKETDAADIYMYWLAVVAQLKDLMDKASRKYEKAVVEDIRRIVNYRFNLLINNERASNIYLTAFALDPNNRGAPIHDIPNPLAVPSIRINPATSSITPKLKLEARVGLSLAVLLRNEYHDAYSTVGITIDQARQAMKDYNPRLAHLTPDDALTALRTQMSAFLTVQEPFTRRKLPNQSNRDYWAQFVGLPDSDVLAALAVKIFSAVPVSMVDERTMSVVTWLNGPKRRRQTVETVSNYLAIRGYNHIDIENTRRKPLSVYWRDIEADIHGTRTSSSKDPEPTSSGTAESESAGSQLSAPDPEDSFKLKWLDDGLPDLSHSEHGQFNLEQEFDIKRYLDILADSASPQTTTRNETAGGSTLVGGPKGGKHGGAAAASAMPDDGSWSRW
ncbi:hypothetical protein HGRIS_014937 [Hohenbuehelia grisea]